MDAVVAEVRGLVADGCGLIVLLDHLRSAESFTLTPMNFMRVVQEATGIHWTKIRDLLAVFDPGLRPTVPPGEVEQLWRALVDQAGHAD